MNSAVVSWAITATLAKNPDYWETDPLYPGKNYKWPYADKLQISIITDSSTLLTAIRTAKIDYYTPVFGGLTHDQFTTLSGQAKGLLSKRRIASTPILAMRTDQKPFDDIRVRKAFNFAIDRVTFVKVEGGRATLWSRRGKDWTREFPEVAEAVKRAALQFADLGAHVEEVDPGFDDVHAIFRTHWYTGAAFLLRGFTAEQLQHPPYVYAFRLPPPNEHVDVFEGDFKKQHTPAWWRALFEQSELLHVEHCAELDDADAIYEEMVRYEHEHGLDPFDVDMCLQQMEWGRTRRPRKTLFVLTARKR